MNASQEAPDRRPADQSRGAPVRRPAPDPAPARDTVRLTVAAMAFCLAICLIAYALLGAGPASWGDALLMFGLPVVLPAVATPIALRRRARADDVPASDTGPDGGPFAALDDLTRVANRRAFFRQAAELAQDEHRLHAIVVVDLDHLRRVNDAFGQPAGDQALQQFGSLLTEICPEDAIIGRLGGEEFGIVLAHVPLGRAAGICNELRLGTPGLEHEVTASFGLTDWRPGAEVLDVAIARAEAALYRAKQHGRNRIETLTAAQAGSEPASDLAPLARRPGNLGTRGGVSE